MQHVTKCTGNRILETLFVFLMTCRMAAQSDVWMSRARSDSPLLKNPLSLCSLTTQIVPPQRKPKDGGFIHDARRFGTGGRSGDLNEN
jgi:hypothetical protein